MGGARPRARRGRHRRVGDRRDRAHHLARARRRGHAPPRRPAAVHHRHRGPARRRSGGRRASSRCSSTTSTICSRSSATTWRGAAPRWRAPKPSSTRKSTAFMTWARSRSAMPTVVALRQRFEAIRQAELVRLQPRLAALPPDGRARVDEITRLIVEKLLITPTEQLKALADREVLMVYADALSHLFALGPIPAAPAGGPPRPRRLTRSPRSDARERRSREPDGARPEPRRRRDRRVTAGTHRHARQPLALWQANAVAAALAAPAAPPREIVVIRTTGDRLSDAPLSRGRRQAAVRQGDRRGAARRPGRRRGTQREGHADRHARRTSRIVAVLPRADPWDALVLPARRAVSARAATSTGAGAASAPRRASARAASAGVASCAGDAGRDIPADPRQPRHAPSQAGRRTVRRDRARLRRPRAAGRGAIASRARCRSPCRCRRRPRGPSPCELRARRARRLRALVAAVDDPADARGDRRPSAQWSGSSAAVVRRRLARSRWSGRQASSSCTRRLPALDGTQLSRHRCRTARGANRPR